MEGDVDGLIVGYTSIKMEMNREGGREMFKY
jgi:hypothetical protein